MATQPWAVAISLVLLSGSVAASDPFLRGDANQDGEVDLSDAVSIFSFLFLGGPAPQCVDAADSDDSGEVDLSDGIRILGFLFTGGAPPAEPFGKCGWDPTGDPIDCDAFARCAGERCTASLAAEPLSGRAPLAVELTAAAERMAPGALRYEWDFDGDGSVDASGADDHASFTYLVAGDFRAEVAVSDQGGLCLARASIAITVDAPNRPPEALGQSLVTSEGVPLEIRLEATDPDGDRLTYRVVSAPQGGRLEGDAPELRYVPEVGFRGEDEFSFVASDGELESELALVVIRVEAATVTVVGRTVDEGFRPLGGARVRAGEVAVVSGQDGRFTLEGVDATGGVAITATAGFLMGRGTGAGLAGAPRRREGAIAAGGDGGGGVAPLDVGDVVLEPLYPTGRFPVGLEPTGLASGDLSGDGLDDLAVANSGSPRISLLVSRGDGTFEPESRVPIAGPVERLALVDLDGDGALDLVSITSSSPAENLSVLLGRGDGTFEAEARTSAGRAPTSLAWGDLDGDGRRDLVAGTLLGSGRGLVVLRGRGDGAFDPAREFPAPRSRALVLADVDGDGALDVVSGGGEEGSAAVSLFPGLGDGTLGPERRLPTVARGIPVDLVARDVTSDGKPDLLVARTGWPALSVFLGRGDGTFEPEQVFSLTSAPAALAVVDSDRDGDLDVVATFPDRSEIEVFHGSGEGEFGGESRYPTLGAGPESIALLDLNGDGLTDLATANRLSHDVSVLLGEGESYLEFRAILRGGVFLAGRTPSALVARDLDGDGLLDVVTANLASSDLSLLLGRGDGTFEPERRFSTTSEPVALGAGDLDRDGDADLVVGSLLPGELRLHWNEGDGTFGPAEQVGYGVAGRIHSLAVADLDGDGWLDIVAGEHARERSTTGCVWLGINDGAGGFLYDSLLECHEVGGGPGRVAVADLDRDGAPDVLCANEGSLDLSVLRGRAGAGLASERRFAIPGQPVSLAVADFNADGALDVAVGSGDNEVWVLPALGDGTFGAAVASTSWVGDYPGGMAAGDVNGDGLEDVVTINNDSEDLSLLLGRGDGTFDLETRFIVRGAMYTVLLADVDASGALDIVAAGGESVVVILHR